MDIYEYIVISSKAHKDEKLKEWAKNGFLEIHPHIVLKCCRCKYRWTPRINTNDIVLCPRCKSPYWNKKRKNKVKSKWIQFM
jgi:hypothetical protein